MTAADITQRRESLEQLAGSVKRIAIGVVLLGTIVGVAYVTGHHAGLADATSALELARADSAIAAAAKLAHAAALRVDSARRATAVARRVALPAIAIADTLRRLVTAADDTTLVVRRVDALLHVTVPIEVIQERRADSVAIARLVVVVSSQDSLVVALDARRGADSTQLAAANEKIEVLERQKAPRCGRKCGVVLGVLGTLGSAIVMDRVRGRPP